MLEVIVFSLAGGLLSLVGAVYLLRNKQSAHKLAAYGTPFAAGVLLATAFTDLLPEALEDEGTVRSVMLAALLGMLIFFMLERYARWFHHHHDEGNNKHQSPNSLIIIGDTLHNALDGIAIGAAFLIDVPTGIITTAAVAAHEIPQEIGDFGLLLRNGMKRRKVLLVNVISALATTATAVLTYALGDSEVLPIPLLLALTAGFFVYIAASDIIPEIHEKIEPGKRDLRPWLLVIGALFIIVVSPIAHEYIDAGHASEATELSPVHTDSH
jgi:zinc and cadmium transporter